MALFGTKKTEAPKTKTAKGAEKKTKAVAKVSTRDLSWVIVKPRITEKAALMSDKNIYVFDISRDANKNDVRDAVVSLYKVTPQHVTIVNRAERTTKSGRTGRWSLVRAIKKAHVTLKKGDTINIV